MDTIRAAAAKRVLFLPHAVKQISRPERMNSPADVERAIAGGEIVEDYPDDVRGHSCLVLGFRGAGQPIHVVCAPKDEYLAIITAYLPDPEQWTPVFRRRIR